MEANKYNMEKYRSSSAALRRLKPTSTSSNAFPASSDNVSSTQEINLASVFSSCHSECKVIRASEARHKGRQGQLGKTSNAVTVATSQKTERERDHFIVGRQHASEWENT